MVVRQKNTSSRGPGFCHRFSAYYLNRCKSTSDTRWRNSKIYQDTDPHPPFHARPTLRSVTFRACCLTRFVTTINGRIEILHDDINNEDFAKKLLPVPQRPQNDTAHTTQSRSFLAFGRHSGTGTPTIAAPRPDSVRLHHTGSFARKAGETRCPWSCPTPAGVFHSIMWNGIICVLVRESCC